MQKLVRSLDIIQTGENGHTEMKWKDGDFGEQLVQLFFQLCRGSGSSRAVGVYGDLVAEALSDRNSERVNFLLSLMVQTRDATDGKKETALFYRMLEVWDRDKRSVEWVLPKLRSILERVLGIRTQDKPYGSFRDVKYLIQCYNDTREWDASRRLHDAVASPILSLLLDLVNKKLLVDEAATEPSLLGKWLPREKSKFGWQAPLFAVQRFDAVEWYGLTGLSKATRLANYRKRIAVINRALSTVQVHQCSGTWGEIDFEKGVTSATLRLQKKAFCMQGKKKPEAMEQNELEDRELCSRNYHAYVDRCSKGLSSFKAKDVTMGQLVKDVWNYSTTLNESVELSYEEKVKEIRERGNLANFCVICDTSGSMEWENAPLHDAIGIAMLIAEASSLGSRVMTFATDPRWMKLDRRSSFKDRVRLFRESQLHTGGSTDLYKSFRLILHAIKEAKMSEEEVGQLNLLLLSDMQINAAVQGSFDVVHNAIKKMFKDSGYSVIPRLVYWNMRATSGFPVSDLREDGTLLLSGYEVSTLQGLMRDGVDALTNISPINNLLKLLASDRYAWFHGLEN